MVRVQDMVVSFHLDKTLHSKNAMSRAQQSAKKLVEMMDVVPFGCECEYGMMKDCIPKYQITDFVTYVTGIDRDNHIWFGNPSNWALQRIKSKANERAKEKVKKLYKVFVIENQEKIHEVNKVAATHQGAMFDVVKELDLEASYDELDVYALEVFTLKKRDKKCC